MGGAAGPLRHVPQADRRRRRGEPEGDPAQAARDGAQGHRERAALGGRSGSLGALHRVYAESVRNLGTPVFSRRYFELLLEAFRGLPDVLTVLDGETADRRGAQFLFPRRGAALLRRRHGGGAGAGGQRFHVLGGDAPRRAHAAAGCSISAAARTAPARSPSRRTGAFRRRRSPTGSGCAPARRCPSATRSIRNTACFIAAWKRLPLPVANAIGPHIVRGLG